MVLHHGPGNFLHISRVTPLLVLLGVLLGVLVSACGSADRAAGSAAGAGSGTSVAANSGIASAGPIERTPEPSPLGAGLVIPSKAPEFVGLTGWINSNELTVAGLTAERRVVLVDFWTYTCINCIRTLPFLTDWHEKYADRGLTIVGVHSPEFDFEEYRPNVVNAVDQYGLRYAVAQDNEMATWRAFNNSFWPAKYLIGVDGSVRYQHFGEGSYDETEDEIRRALTDAGYNVSDIPRGGVDAQRLDPHATAITRELYGGYERNFTSNGRYAAQAAYYEAPDRTFEYQDVEPETQRNHNQFYLQGVWRNEREAVVHGRDTAQPDDYVALRFVARSVNVVLRSATKEPYTVIVEIDGWPLLPEEAGADVTFDEQGRSVVLVDDPRVYRVVELPMLGDRELRLRSTSSNFSLFAVTFGAYTSGG
ncbi:MAG: redoxin domain-containing protein [Chloroflexi bacterium]|nr:redoxin domain-containing protein [Chloroflexota bacterium]MDA1145987.1 redoxin domain-containing protein [Chloroflexota bacterium]